MKILYQLFFSFFILISFFTNQSQAQSISLHTPITKIIAPPGKEINYKIEAINNTSNIKTSNIKIIGLPKDWSYDLKLGGWNVEQFSVQPRDKETLSLKVKVPIMVEKGTYPFKILTNGYPGLNLAVNVSKEGTYETLFTSDQPNIEGASNTTFTYNANLKNGTSESQVYALKANAPKGWLVLFKANGKQVSSVNVEPNDTQRITIEVRPSEYTKKGSYKIPILAQAEQINTRLELETVITGNYSLALATPTDLLSTDAVAGEEKTISLLVKNTGSANISDIKLNSRTPSNWKVNFEPKEIALLEPGKTKEVEATISVYDKALSGDYETHFEARATEASTKSAFRITVKASFFSAGFGIMIILLAIGSVYFLIRKYGRQ